MSAHSYDLSYNASLTSVAPIPLEVGNLQKFGGEGQGDGMFGNGQLLDYIAVIVIVVIIFVIVLWRIIYVRRLRSRGLQVSYFFTSRRIRIPFTKRYIGHDGPRLNDRRTVDMVEVGRDFEFSLGDQERRRRRRRRRQPMTGPEIGEGGRRGGERDEDYLDEEEWEFDGDGVPRTVEGSNGRRGGEREELPEYFRKDAALPSYNRTMARDRLGNETFEQHHQFLFYSERRRGGEAGDGGIGRNLSTEFVPSSESRNMNGDREEASRGNEVTGVRDSEMLSLEDYERRTRAQTSTRERDEDEEEQQPVATVIEMPARPHAAYTGIPPRYSFAIAEGNEDVEVLSRSSTVLERRSQEERGVEAEASGSNQSVRQVRKGRQMEDGDSVESLRTVCSENQGKGEGEEDEGEKRNEGEKMEETEVKSLMMEKEGDGKGKEKDNM